MKENKWKENESNLDYPNNPVLPENNNDLNKVVKPIPVKFDYKQKFEGKNATLEERDPERLTVYIDNHNRWFLTKYDYERCFAIDREDVFYLPTQDNTSSIYDLLTKNERDILSDLEGQGYIKIEVVQVDDLDVYIDEVDGDIQYLTDSTYNLIFKKDIPVRPDGYTRLTKEEIAYNKKYYNLRYHILKSKRINNQDDINRDPKAIEYMGKYFLRPDVAIKNNIEGILIPIRYTDEKNVNKEGIYSDIPTNILHSTTIIPDLNNSKEVYHADHITINNKEVNYVDTFIDQDGTLYCKPEIKNPNLEGLANEYNVDDGYGEERTKLMKLESPLEIQSAKLLRENCYPLFDGSPKQISIISNLKTR